MSAKEAKSFHTFSSNFALDVGDVFLDLEEDEASSFAKSNLEEEVGRDSDEEEEVEELALPRFAPPTVSFTGFNAQGYIAWPRLGE